ncbi:mechanosensitive ion channel domain-containing protein [Erythrobacter sp.]|uniref:mechanosensitive ion channel domain-containing protein n=1 Tax=Erythrobacter sp. TaxID=1042 RepID=UPI0025CD1273|nr:mechanosensitive ion channel domain-containing protein [Erythrobacter sp.]
MTIRAIFPAIVAALLLCLSTALHAQSAADLTGAPAAEPAEALPDDPIDPGTLTEETDRAIASGLANVFTQIEGLRDVGIAVQSGVVTLSGTVTNQADRERAEAIAARIEGVVTVENAIDRSYEVETNVSPAVKTLLDNMRGLVRGLPLFGVALVIGVLIAGLGYLLAGRRRLWLWATPNPFLAELLAGAIRVAAILAGLVVALQIVDATAMLGLVLGSAGIIGIALGFAVRDTVDNYVSSLMLSLRQPFRANDHVVIDGCEGRVIRLTSRATVLMTLDGNHLRIPNAKVFKAIILNYTRNPQRRFEFELGVDSADDPLGAMEVGLQAIRALPFVLDEPRSQAVIQTVGESSIILRFFAWVDQGSTDFLKGRSLAIQAAKHAVEEAGDELPEPIYRIRVDDRRKSSEPAPADAPVPAPAAAKPRKAPPMVADGAEPDRAVEKLVSEERGSAAGSDLLDTQRPIE